MVIRAYHTLVLMICVIGIIGIMKQSNFQREFTQLTSFQKNDSQTTRISMNSSFSKDRHLSQQDDISEAGMSYHSDEYV